MRSERTAEDRSPPLQASVSVLEPKPADGACVTPVPSDPCSIVILGATGDLTSRKLMPALYSLYRLGRLPESFLILGCGRTPWSDEEFRDRMAAAIRTGGGRDLNRWPEFARRLYYRSLDYQEPRSFIDLAEIGRASCRERV